MTMLRGQTIRLTGLLIEVPCVLGLYSLKQGKLGHWDESAIDPASVLSVGIGIGFVLWITGTVLIHWPNDRRKPRSRMFR